MCEKTRKRLESLRTVKSPMTSGAREGFAIMLEEITKTNQAIAEIKAAQLQQNERQTAVENGLCEVLKVVNNIQDKLTINQIEDKAAVMTFLQKIVSTKTGKAFILFLFIFSGLAFAYMIEHGVFEFVAKVFS